MSGRDLISANLPGNNEKLIKLQVIVAEAARDRRASGKILLDERPHHIALKTLFVIDHVIRNAESLGNTTRIVDVVNRAAAALHGFRHAFVASKSALVPELHGQADEAASFGAEHGRDCRGVDSSRHGYSD